jgi:putative transposase
VKQEWFSAAELASLKLPMLAGTTANIIVTARREGWQDAEREGTWWRARAGRGGGVEYHIVVLPQAARKSLLLQKQPVRERVMPVAPSATDCAAMWAWFERQTDTKKRKAAARLEVIDAIRQLTDHGFSKTMAMDQVAAEAKVAPSSIYAWEKLVHRVPRQDWLPFLAPRHAGQTGARVDCSPEAWEFFKANYLRLERPTITATYRYLQRAGAEQGWTIPCEKTLARRIEALPAGVVTLAREGREALARMYPAQSRDRSALSAMEVLNADFHKWDVFVRWWDGEIVRPQMVSLQDIYSGKQLGWRLDKQPNKHAVRLCIGDVVEAFGVPQHIVLDNGREFASKWLTGGTPTRYRFKVREEDPEGLLVQLGVHVHWATPYHGQAKPIERMFRDFAGDTAKHPAFAGAYTGNTPLAKPENYGSTAVPLDTFIEVLASELAEHNARIGRTGGVCAGRSFDAVFDASYAEAAIRKTSAEQRRLWLMAAEAITVGRMDGAIMLEGNRFWSEALHPYRGQKIVARFDPMALQDDLHVYRQDGAYIGAAPCVAASGFLNADDAREHAQKRKRFMKATREVLVAERGMRLSEVAKLLPKYAEAAPPPSSRVVQLVTGNTVRRVATPDLEEQSEAEAALVAAMRGNGARLRVVEAGED